MAVVVCQMPRDRGHAERVQTVQMEPGSGGYMDTRRTARGPIDEDGTASDKMV